MIKKVILRDPNDMTPENINKFWISFIRRLEQKEFVKEYFNDKYIENDKGDFNSNISFYEKEYNIFYGESFQFLKICMHGMNLEMLIQFLEIMISEWINTGKRDEFSAEINRMLKRFKVPHVICYNNAENKDGETSVVEIQVPEKALSVQKTSCGEKNIVSDIYTEKGICENVLHAIINVQKNPSNQGKTEDQLNDAVRDCMDMIYHLSDQARQGESESGKSAGELDILIKKNRNPIAVIEALKLDSLEKTNLDKHINKTLTKYDPVGCPVAYVLIYYGGKEFADFWEKTLNYLETYTFPYDTVEKFSEMDHDYTESRHGSAILLRSGKNINLHVYAINMNWKTVGES